MQDACSSNRTSLLVMSDERTYLVSPLDHLFHLPLPKDQPPYLLAGGWLYESCGVISP